MSVNYAVREPKSCGLGTDWAREFVARQFGQVAADAIYAALPLYQRGPRKGQPKGWVLWTKCVKGGWVKTGAYDHDGGRGCGFVMAPGTHDVKIVLTNPNYLPGDRFPSLDAGDRRGLPTDPNRETDQQWAGRCAHAIYVLAGKPVPAELAAPVVPELCHPKAATPKLIVLDVMGYYVAQLTRENRVAALADETTVEAACMVKLWKAWEQA